MKTSLLAILFAVLILAAVLVASLLIAATVASFWTYRRRYSVPQAVLLILAWLFVKLQWRAKLPQEFPIALDKGAVIVSNHCSSIDPFFVQVSSGRPIHWMVAKEFCEHPLFRGFLRTCEVIPVNRGGIDTAATLLAIRLVKEGGIVGVFPEGRINMSDEFMLPVRPGAIMIAHKAGVPIYPCHIDGSPYSGTPWSPFTMRARVRVQIGDPLPPPDDPTSNPSEEEVGRLMTGVVRAIATLAGRPEFEPQLAGRRWKPTSDQLEADMAASRARRRRKHDRS